MKYFKCINESVSIADLQKEILQNEALWNQEGVRKRTPVQTGTNAIFLRTFNPEEKEKNKLKNKDNQESHWTNISEKFPLACKFIKDYSESVGGTLSRALIAQLQPHGTIYRHIDDGSYYLIRDRYHLVIKSENKTVFYAGDEETYMKEGELWWFDNKQHHQVENQSSKSRIHLIFDILPKKYSSLGKNPVALEALPKWYKEAAL